MAKPTKQKTKGPRMLGKKENPRDFLNVYTDSRGDKWEMPVGDLLRSQSKLQEMKIKNEQESMKLERKRIEADMLARQQEAIRESKIEQSELAKRQDISNSMNYGLAMYGLQGNQQLPQEQNSIFPSVLQSQGQMAQGQMGLLQQQMQGQQGLEQQQQKGQMDYQTLMEEIAKKYAAEMGIEKYRQGEESKRESERTKSNERISNMMYNAKDLKTQAEGSKLLSSKISKSGTTLRSELFRIMSSPDMKDAAEQFDSDKFNNVKIKKVNEFLDSVLSMKGTNIQDLIDKRIIVQVGTPDKPIYIKGDVDSDDQDIQDILDNYSQAILTGSE